MHRGDIIVDTSTLLGLCVDIEGSGDGKEHKNSYLDVLIFLARNGYQIIIPEIILYESSYALSSGHYVGDFFNNKENKEEYREKLLDKILNRSVILNEFNSPPQPNNNIFIVPDTGLKAADEFCASIKDCMREDEEKMLTTQDRKEQLQIRNNTRDRITEITKKQKQDYPVNLGDDAIISLLQIKYNTRCPCPVFVLSDDIGLLKKVSDIGCSSITTSSLIYSLGSVGLLEEAGFPEGSTPYVLEERRRKELPIQNNGHKNTSFHKDEELYKKCIESRPLTLTLRRLKKDLDRQREDGVDDERMNVVHKIRASDAKLRLLQTKFSHNRKMWNSFDR